MKFRRAKADDLGSLLILLNNSEESGDLHKNFDLEQWCQSLLDQKNIVYLCEKKNKIHSFLSILIDSDQKIGKIQMMRVLKNDPHARDTLRKTLSYSINQIKENFDLDLLYTTTFSMSLEIQGLTLEEDFKVLGVFPNALGFDDSKLNGLSAYYLKNDVLSQKRMNAFKLHPVLEPFYNIVKDQFQLEKLEIDTHPEIEFNRSASEGENLKTLSFIDSENFVKHRFNFLKSDLRQVIDFYPFHKPNALITHPDQGVEVFVRINREKRFAAIIGEHLSQPVDPVHLYQGVLKILKEKGISYVEVISDAADSLGVSFFLQAGFTPSAYIPAFKIFGNRRRDYAVLGKSFEFLCRPNFNVHPLYKEFYKEYFKLEGKNYFPENHL